MLFELIGKFNRFCDSMNYFCVACRGSMEYLGRRRRSSKGLHTYINITQHNRQSPPSSISSFRIIHLSSLDALHSNYSLVNRCSFVWIIHNRIKLHKVCNVAFVIRFDFIWMNDRHTYRHANAWAKAMQGKAYQHPAIPTINNKWKNWKWKSCVAETRTGWWTHLTIFCILTLIARQY